MASKKRSKKGKSKRRAAPKREKAIPKPVSEKKENLSGKVSSYIAIVSDYIDNTLKKGYNEKDIKKTLLSVGWPEDVIDDELSKIKGKKAVKGGNYFARLLFIFIVVLVIVIYALLIFGSVPVGVKSFGSLMGYIIFGLLIVVLIFLVSPLLLITKGFYKGIKEKKEEKEVEDMIKSKKKGFILSQANLEKEIKKAEELRLKSEKKGIKSEEKEKRKLEKEKIKEEKTKKKEEGRRIKLLEKEKKKAEKLRLKELKRRTKKPGVFSRLFKKKEKEEEEKPKEEKKEIRKEEVVAVKKGVEISRIKDSKYPSGIKKEKQSIFLRLFKKKEKEGKELKKEKVVAVKKEKVSNGIDEDKKKAMKNLEIGFIVLFLLSIAAFLIAYFYDNVPLGGISLLSFIISILVIIIIRIATKEKKELPVKKEKKKESLKEVSKLNIFSRLFKKKAITKEKEGEEKPKEEKKEIKLTKEKIFDIKEDKEAEAKSLKKKKRLKVFFIILLLLSIGGIVVAYIYSNTVILGVSVVLIIVSIIGLIKTKNPKESKGKNVKKEKVKLVKELPRAKIELGKYETDLDELYRLVEEKGRLKLSAVANYFGVDKKIVGEWSTILEEHNLTKMNYPAVGEPEISRIDKKTEQIKEEDKK